MNATTQWDEWLASEDSEGVLAPAGYDGAAALLRVKVVRDRLKGTLDPLEIRASSTALFQDGTALIHYRVMAQGDTAPFAPTLAWILLSHFGDLTTVVERRDPELLVRISRVLQDCGLKYIPVEYLASNTYNGKCGRLVGLSWENRYFALVPKFNDKLRGGWLCVTRKIHFYKREPALQAGCQGEGSELL